MQYIASMETITINKGSKCFLCSQYIKKGEQVLRIPTCLHFFHSDCLKKQFLTKLKDDDQKCPKCERVLKTKELQEAKKKNESDQIQQENAELTKEDSERNIFRDPNTDGDQNDEEALSQKIVIKVPKNIGK